MKQKLIILCLVLFAVSCFAGCKSQPADNGSSMDAASSPSSTQSSASQVSSVTANASQTATGGATENGNTQNNGNNSLADIPTDSKDIPSQYTSSVEPESRSTESSGTGFYTRPEDEDVIW